MDPISFICFSELALEILPIAAGQDFVLRNQPYL